MSRTPTAIAKVDIPTLKSSLTALESSLSTVALYKESIQNPSIKCNQEEFQKALTSLLEVGPLVVNFCKVCCDKFSTNSTNSSLPPSQNPNRPKIFRAQGKRKTGGQPGHPGATMAWEKPNRVVACSIDLDKLPPGHTYTKVEPEVRQVIEIYTEKKVVHYYAEVYVDENGKRYVAKFPPGVNARLQYGNTVTATVVELSVNHMLPKERLSQYLQESFSISISEGTIVNKLKRVYSLLEDFDLWVRRRLLTTPVCHFDETGCNVNGKSMWIHTANTDKLFYFFLSEKRGRVACDEIGILPAYQGVAVHDCWGSYFGYTLCEHAICCAHILRELQGVIDREQYRWAQSIKKCLLDALEAKNSALEAVSIFDGPFDVKADFIAGAVSEEVYTGFVRRLRNLLTRAETACGLNVSIGAKASKAGEKTKNLVKRLRKLLDSGELLMFLRRRLVPFTNNAAERALRMMKVHEKVSGCFRSKEAGKHFARIRSYLCTCEAYGMTAREALITLLKGRLPSFIRLDEDLPQLLVIQQTGNNSTKK